MPLTQICKGIRRNKVKTGDIFVFSVQPGHYGFGRVVDTQIKMGPWVGAALVYVYDERVKAASLPELPELSRERLMLPPMITDYELFKEGKFCIVASRPIQPGDLLTKHCFRDRGGHVLDENGEPLSSVMEPCGKYALTTGIGLEVTICDAIQKTDRLIGNLIRRRDAGGPGGWGVSERPAGRL
jgi:hypothetical protein